MQTNDSGNLFKTDAQLAKESSRSLKLERTKTVGEPIKLSSKPLAMEVRGNDCWTAESGFVVRRMDLRVRPVFPVLISRMLGAGKAS